MTRKKIVRTRARCATCGQGNVCHTLGGVPYTRHTRGARHRAAEQRQWVTEMLLSEQLADLAVERVTGFTYLFAKTAEGQGYFVVVDRDGLGVLDRAAYRAIAAERTQAGLSPLLHVFARLSTYSGPNLRVDQPGWR